MRSSAYTPNRSPARPAHSIRRRREPSGSQRVALLVTIGLVVLGVRLGILARTGEESAPMNVYAPAALSGARGTADPDATRAAYPAPEEEVAPAATDSPSGLRLAVHRDVYDAHESDLAAAATEDGGLVLLPYTDAAPIVQTLITGRAAAAILWSATPPETPYGEPFLLRSEPYALATHPAMTRQDFTLKQLREVATGLDQTYSLATPEGGARLMELLGIDELGENVVPTGDWLSAKEYAATHENTIAVLPWAAVDFRVRLATVEGQAYDPHGTGDYPLARRAWLLTSEPLPSQRVATLARALRWEPLPTVELVAVGDILLASYVGDHIAQEGPDYPFTGEGVRELLAGADLALGNLECAISTQGEPQPKEYTFRAAPVAVEGLRRAGLDVLSLANNHTGDYGTAALLDTLDIVGRAGITAIGAGKTITEAHRAQYLEVNGVEIALLAYNNVPPDSLAATDSAPGAAFMDPQRMAGEVMAARDRADVVIVQCHWGQESTEQADATQRELAGVLSQAGASLVLGHHPHVVQGLRYDATCLTAYSLGNFVFYEGPVAETLEGVALRCLLDETGVKTVELVPYRTALCQPRLVGPEEGRGVLERIARVTAEQGGYPLPIQAPEVQ